MNYLLYVKVDRWSTWMYYGMVSSFTNAITSVEKLRLSFYDAKYRKEINAS